ncbi:MAG: hypothetical protein BMS9Abin05_0137 [Rhodothermia bacterium]|nr:MAG: hypothetical protein BMS9Abin05_0137 [Rhodothermia bacterium]
MPEDTVQTLDQVLSTLKIEASRPHFETNWARTISTFADRQENSLSPDSIQANCRLLGMNFKAERALIERAFLFADVPELAMLHWHCHQELVMRLNERIKRTRTANSASEGFDWPNLSTKVHPDIELFYVYVFLSTVPRLIEFHHQAGIPEFVTTDTLSDLELWLLDFKEETGRWGFREQDWLSRHFAGDVFKIGRLQFETTVFKHPFRVFRRKANQSIQILAEGGLEVREDGLLNGTDNIRETDVWKTSLYTGAVARGHPVTPDGSISPDPVQLDEQEWNEILKVGDSVLGVHIPATGPMDYIRCCRSFSRSLPFFRRHFPDFEPRAYTCSSWLLDRQLKDQLSADTNIVRFLNEWNLIPEPDADQKQTIERVFGAVGPDIDTWPKNTSLQKMMAEHMEKGGCWRMGAGIVIPDSGSFVLDGE